MKIKIIKTTWVSVLSGMLMGAVLSVSLNVSALKETSDEIPVAELQKFSEVMSRIKRDYVEEVDDKKLITDAIRGMLSGLDPHSAYLDSDEFTELQADTSGKFGGLGIEVGMENGFIKVISPIDDTPAARAGVKAGDLIIRLDDEHVKGKNLNEAVKIMRGKVGDPISLTIIREGEIKPLKIKIIRDIIKIKGVKQRLLGSGYGYLRIVSFQSNTTDAAKIALKKLEKENEGKLKGLVIDLRDNPGGVLGAAVGISDLFIEEGKIVYTDGRVDDSKMTEEATNFDVMEGAPIVVLVNKGSASASEIVAGALQDHKRALIMGEKTFGKGSVQTVLPLDATTAVKLTTARYYTPSGRSIQAKGIEPDIIVKTLKFAKEDDGELSAVSEASLSGHLSNPEKKEDKDQKKSDENDEVKTGTKSKIKNDSVEKDANKDTSKDSNNKGSNEENDTEKDNKDKHTDLIRTDYQLYEALNILKGMDLFYGKRK